MKAPLLLKSIVVAFVILCPAFAVAGGPSNILADGGAVKPSINFTESYVDKVFKIKSPNAFPYYEMPVTATVIGNLQGVDTSGFNNDTPVKFTIGGLSFVNTLGNSKEAAAAKGFFPPRKTKATFLLGWVGNRTFPGGDRL